MSSGRRTCPQNVRYLDYAYLYLCLYVCVHRLPEPGLRLLSISARIPSSVTSPDKTRSGTHVGRACAHNTEPKASTYIALGRGATERVIHDT